MTRQQKNSDDSDKVLDDFVRKHLIDEKHLSNWHIFLTLVAVVLLFFFPIGTIVSVLIFYHLYKKANSYADNVVSSIENIEQREAMEKKQSIEQAKSTKYGKRLQKLNEEEKRVEEEKQSEATEQRQERETAILSAHQKLINFLKLEATEINKLPELTCLSGFQEEINEKGLPQTYFEFSMKKRFGVPKLSLQIDRKGIRNLPRLLEYSQLDLITKQKIEKLNTTLIWGFSDRDREVLEDIFTQVLK